MELHHYHSGAVLIKYCPQCAASIERMPTPPEGKLQLCCAACGFIYYQNPKVVAGVIAHQEGRVLLLKRKISPSYGKWTFPGGYVDVGESVTEAAARETLEEVNLEVRIGRLLNVYSYPELPVVIIVYLGEIVAGAPRPGVEAQEVRFFAPSEIPWDELAFKSTAEALRDWISTLDNAV